MNASVLYYVKLDEMFALWLSEPNTQLVVDAIAQAAADLEAGKPATVDFALFDAARAGAPTATRHKPPSLVAASAARAQPVAEPEGPAAQPAISEHQAVCAYIQTFDGPVDAAKELADVDAACAGGSVGFEAAAALLQTHCRLPRVFAPLLLKGAEMAGPAFARFWRDHLLGRDPNSRFFSMIVAGERDFVFPSDLAPFVRTLVESHASLQFLKDEAMFQEKFIDFIVTRCFFIMDVELRGTVGLSQFRRMDLASVFFNAERMADVNDTQHVFNYQHFYVAFCKFWDLDGDSDGFILKEDMMKFNESAISPIIIKRFFQSRFYPRSSNKKQTLDFTGFSYFLMNTEDKTSPTAIDFWFKLCDLDEDGVLSLQEIEELYEIQYERMQIMGNETIPFRDIIRQLMDVVHPKDPAYVTRGDLTRSKLADVFFNTIFDLQKFLVREYQFPLVNPNSDEAPLALGAARAHRVRPARERG